MRILLIGDSLLSRSLQTMIEERLGLQRAVLSTNRTPLGGEVDGLHYKFMTKENYSLQAAAGHFALSMKVGDDFYGYAEQDLPTHSVGVMLPKMLKQTKLLYPDIVSLKIVDAEETEWTSNEADYKLSGAYSTEELFQAYQSIHEILILQWSIQGRIGQINEIESKMDAIIT